MESKFFPLKAGDFIIVDYTGNITITRGEVKVRTFLKYQNLSFHDLKKYSNELLRLITGICGLSFENGDSNEGGICFNIIDSR